MKKIKIELRSEVYEKLVEVAGKYKLDRQRRSWLTPASFVHQ